MASNSNPKNLPGQQTRTVPFQKKRSGNRKVSKKPISSTVRDPRVASMYSKVKAISGSQKYLELARSIVLPGNVANARPLPSTTPAQLSTRIIKKNFVLGAANITADGRAAILVTPDMFGPAYFLKPGTTLLPVAPGPFFINGASNSSGDLLGTHNGMSTFTDGVLKATAMQQQVTLGGDTRFVYDISCVSACTIDVKVRIGSSGSEHGVKYLRFFTSTAGAWSAAFAGISLPLNGELNSGTISMAANTRYFGWYITDDTGASLGVAASPGIHLSLTYGALAQTPQASLGGTADQLFQEIPEYLLDSKIESGCVNSVGVLVSNTSAALQKQGEIFAARSAKNILADWANVTDNMVALPPTREYHGPAEFGAYAWWMPDTIETTNPTTIAEYTTAISKQDILLIYMRGLNANSSFNVSFAWNVSFYTPNQLFEKIVTPPQDEAWMRMYHSLGMLPACSCNPEHESLFKSIIDRGSAMASKAYGHYKDNQGTYDALVKILLALV